MRVLNVAEKPSVASAIASILGEGRARKRDGGSRYNPVFEFSYSVPGLGDCAMSVTSVAGHLLETEFEARYAKWHSCDPKDLFFKAKVIKQIPSKFEALATMLKSLARNSDMLVMWLDCDREGEAIGYEVLEVCQQSNPRIQVKRAHFSALIPRDIHNAMRTLTAPDPHLRDAVEARSEIDLRLGAAFTRYQTLRLQRRFKGCGNGEFDSVISYGPCQFPTLGFVVERYKKIEGFVPQGFWAIDLDIKIDKAEAKFRWVRDRLFDRACCAILFEELVEAAEATVVDINNRRTTRSRPVPLSTVEMQKALSRAPMRLSSSKSMEIAETLYQKGFISYPRTETDKFKEGTDMQALIQIQAADPQWGGFATMLLTGGFLYPTDGGHDDGAHPPIHPTKAPLNLNAQEQMVYEYIARHFLACCSRDAVGQQSIVTVSIGSDERFTARGLAISERNFLDVYKYERWGENALPLFQLHQKYKPSKLWMRESRTEPPPLLSEVDLITLMDKNGIGTDATIAQHIKTIQERNYAECSNHVFTPTSLGLGLVDGYESLQLQMAQPTLRAHMEASLKLVACGHKRKEDVISETLSEMHRVYESVEAQAQQLDSAMDKYYPRQQGQINLAFRPLGPGGPGGPNAPPAPPRPPQPPPPPPPGGGGGAVAASAGAGSAAAAGGLAPPAFHYVAGASAFRPPIVAPRNSVRPGVEGPAGFVNADRVPSPSDFGGDGAAGWGGGGGGSAGGTGRGSKKKTGNGGASSAASKRGGRGGRAAATTAAGSARRASPSSRAGQSDPDGFDGFGGDFQSSYRQEQQQRARHESGGFSAAPSAFVAPPAAAVAAYGGGGGDDAPPSWRYNPNAAGGSAAGGGGGGADLSAITCYRCHTQGHYATSCPTLTGGGGGGRAAASSGSSYSSSRGRGSSAGSGRGGGRGGRGGGGGGGGSKDECFHCHQTGHWSANCPNKNN